MVRLVIKVDITSITALDATKVIDKAKEAYYRATVTELLEGIVIEDDFIKHNSERIAWIDVERV